MKKLLPRVILGAALVSMTAAESEYYTHETRPGDYVKKVDVDGRAREYRLHVPRGYDGAHPLPLMFVFHGSSASASVIERETSMDGRADSIGFIVVYPEGLHRAWNIGECCRFAFKQRVDETAFVSSILDRLERGLAIDRSRVYAAGYSDGGTLAYLLGCKLSHRITAVAGVSATLFEPKPTCKLARPVPAFVAHGTGDTHIPYTGSAGARPEIRAPHFTHSAPEVTQFWVEHDHCDTAPETTKVARVVRVQYKCPEGAEVLFYTIEEGQHGWPGGGRGWIFSPEPPTDMIATDSIVKFFLRHQLPSVSPDRNSLRSQSKFLLRLLVPGL